MVSRPIKTLVKEIEWMFPTRNWREWFVPNPVKYRSALAGLKQEVECFKLDKTRISSLYNSVKNF